MTPSQNQPADPHQDIRIAGVGMVSPLGLTAWENLAALLAGKCITDRLPRLPEDIVPVDLVKTLGSVIFAQQSATDPSVDLAERALREAIMQANWAPGNDQSAINDIPVYLGISKGAMHAMASALDRHGGLRGARTGRAGALGPPPVADSHLAVALGPVGYVAHHLSRKLGCTEVNTVVAACASSLTALHMARMRLLHDPSVSRVLVATSESALMHAFVYSYHRLGVLPTLTPAACHLAPLDQTRAGFLPVEIAGAIALERIGPGPRPASGLKSRITLLDTLAGCEAYDLIRPAPAMPALLHVAARLVAGRDIDVLHPHATGTHDHDPSELAALAQACAGQAQAPDVYACKGAMGHGLGAAGLVSTIIACMSGVAQTRPPMPWLKTPLQTTLPLTARPPKALGKRSTHAIFSAGFGGHVAGAVVQIEK
jgi:3-oxoacyl-[acyl-carrier-protein] synthase II